MKGIPDKSIDMILCDLPYGTTSNPADIVIPFSQLWEQYERVIKDDGAILLFAQGIFYVDLVNSNRKMYRYDLVWDKELTSGFLNANRRPLRQHEQIAVFYKKMPVYNPQFAVGKPSHSKGKAYLSKEQKNQNYGKYKAIAEPEQMPARKYPTSILRFSKPAPSKALHRTQKPVALCEYLIKTYTDEGDVVLDNCAGSGTTCIAAVNTNRQFIGMEIDKEYYKIAQEKIDKAIENRENKGGK